MTVGITAVTGATQTWTIAEVKPCWLQAFHHLTGTFSQMFPDTPGFAAVPMTEGDVEPALEFVRRHSEAARERADLYLVNNLPIAFIAGGELGGSIAFTGYLVSIGEEVRVCHGTEEERSTALAHIDDNSRSGAVLDAFTAWHAAALDILPVLEERLGPLAVPASELQRLKAMIKDHEAMAGEETMSLAYEDGQYVRQIITGEEHAEYSAQIRSRVMIIEEACVVEPMVIPDDLSELGEAMIRSPSGDTAAAAILAGRGRLLLSEDMMMRRLASEVFGVKGVWVQAVLLSAVQARSMAVDAYADVLVHLAAHRHGYVALNISVLLSTFERDSGDEFLRLQALCAYVGNKNAEPYSHIRLAADFINQIWSNGPPHDFRVNKATNLVFRALLFRHRGREWANWAALLFEILTEGPSTSLIHWCRGHFLPLGDLEEAVRKNRDKVQERQ